MLVTLTLRCGPATDPESAVPVDRDVVVSGPDGTTLGAVAAKLAALVGRPGADLYAGSTLLSAETAFGAPGLRDGCILGVGRAGPRPDLSAAVLELRVVSGVDAGAAIRLTRGEHVIGRGTDCAIRLADPLTSRRHALLQVTTDGVGVRDLGATNRSRLDGRHLEGHRLGDHSLYGADRSERLTAMAPGQLLRVGDTVLSLAVPDGVPAETRRSPGGTLGVDRPPRIPRAATDAVVDWPRPPEPRARARLPVIALILPLVAGVLLAVLFRRPEFLLFTLLSPLMMLGNFLSDRSGRRRGRGQDLRDHAEALRLAESARDRAAARDCLARRGDCPDPAALAAIAHGPGQRLWQRRPGDPDFGLLRLGTGTVSTDVLVRTDGVSSPWPAADLPVTVPLAAVGVLGLAGPHGPLLALARSLVCQLAVLHSPRELGILLLAAGERAAQWEWLRWLPHRRRAPPLADLVALLDDRLFDALRLGGTGSAGCAPRPDLVLVLPDAGRLRAEPAIARLLAEGPQAGILAVCLDREPRRLPVECAVVGTITGDIGSRLVVHGAGRAMAPGEEAALLDGISEPMAERIARALAPLRDPGGRRGHPPREVRLLDLLRLAEPSAAAVAAAWAGYDGVPRLTLGHDGRGPCTVDLVRDGPHTLVAGTTGAGKSELLQTLVAGLAASAPPDALQFVLVDYKGGAAFRECARLPHTSGLVTDLDEHLTRRALRSLSAELVRRERLLATVGATDLAGYEAARRAAARREVAPGPEVLPGPAPLARLMIVVDEFAALARELPDFVGGLVSIAARGRSLGVHLVLATQRPGGVVTPEIRANTSLRIALRVTDEGESRDVIDQAGAARISRHTPGRALVRSGTEPATLVQTARIAGHPPRQQDEISVRLASWPASPAAAAGPIAAAASQPASGPTRVPGAPAPAPAEPSDLERLVAACRDAAHRAGFAPLPSPWLPPLPEVLRHDDLPAAGAGTAVFGLVDCPDSQARTPLGFDPATDASLVVAGGPGSGRTTALRTLLAALAERWSADDLHVHLLDCGGGGLAAAARLPHCGTSVGREDTARGRRLLTRLVEELEARQALLARCGCGSLTEYRTGSTAPPYLVLALDGWESFVDVYEPVDNGQPVEALLRLIREGGAAGIRVVIASGRSGLGVRLSGAVGRRIVLPLADPADYALAGVPLAAVPAHRPPGRGLLPGSRLECQLAVVGADPSGAAQTAALQACAEAGVPAHAHPPLSIAELPRCIALGGLPPGGGARRPLLGVGGDAAAPLWLDLDTLGSAFLVAGPPRSGRTTALLALAHSLLAAGASPVVVAARRSPLRMAPGGPAVAGPTDVELVQERLTAGAGVVLADDIEALVDTPIDGLLAELVDADDGTVVIGAGRVDDLAGAFRGVGVRLRRRRTGLLLNPGPLDGELLGVRLPRGLADRVPGRGWLVEHGTLTRIQVALPPGGTTPGAGTPPPPAGRRSP